MIKLDAVRKEEKDKNTLSELGAAVFASDNIEEIDKLVLDTHKATNIPLNTINQYIHDSIYLPSAEYEGRSTLYQWLDSRQIFNTGYALEKKGVLEGRLEQYDKEELNRQSVGYFEQTIRDNIKTWKANGLQSVADLGIEKDVTLPNGKTQKISKDDVAQIIWNDWLTEVVELERLPPEMRDKAIPTSGDTLYREFANAGLVPPPLKDDLQSGIPAFLSGNLTDDNTLARAETAYNAYRQADGYNITVSRDTMSTEATERFQIVDILVQEAGMDVRSALLEAQSANLSTMKNVRVTAKQFAEAANTATWSQDLLDASNSQEIYNRVNDLTKTFMSTNRLSLDKALAKAIEVVEADTKYINTTDGNNTMAIHIRNTGITRNGKEATLLQENLNLASQQYNVANMIDYWGGTGLAIRNSDKDNLLNLEIVDADGLTVFNIGYVTPEDFSSKERMIALMLSKEEYFIQQGVYDPVETTAFPEVGLELNSLIQREIPEAFIKLQESIPEESVLNYAIQEIQKGRNVPMMSLIGEIPQDMTVETITPLLDKSGQPTGMSLFAGRLANGDAYFVKSLQSPDDYTGQNVTITEPLPESIDNTPPDMATLVNNTSQTRPPPRPAQVNVVDTIQDQTRPPPRPAQNNVIDANQFTPSDATSGKEIESITSMQGDTTEEKAINLLIEHEGFDPNPYPDGKDRSVGYGFYIPALEPDEKALIKDINNVTKEEANAVLKLKVSKIQNFLRSELPEFEKMSGETQSSVISMAYQLGAENIKIKFPTFFENLKLATEATQGSFEQAAYLKKAADNMLYNFDEEGNIKSKTLWHQQTPNRANAMAQGLIMQNQQAEGLQAVADVANESFDALRQRALAAQENKSIEQVPMSDQTNQIGKSVEDVAAVDNARFEEIRQNALEYAERNPDSVIDMLDKVIADKANEIIPSHFKAFVQDIFKVDLDTARTEDFFRDVEQSAMKDVVLASIKRTGNATSGTVTYEDYETGISDVTWGANTDPLSLTNAQGAVKKTLGQFSWRIDENGDLIITDQYNFNDAQKYRKQYPSEAAKIKHLMGLGLGVVSGDISTYGWLRRVGALYGSEEDMGARFEINLGKIN
jgi:GH24 family phage-related lysozyme (muramidase)